MESTAPLRIPRAVVVGGGVAALMMFSWKPSSPKRDRPRSSPSHSSLDEFQYPKRLDPDVMMCVHG